MLGRAIAPVWPFGLVQLPVSVQTPRTPQLGAAARRQHHRAAQPHSGPLPHLCRVSCSRCVPAGVQARDPSQQRDLCEGAGAVTGPRWAFPRQMVPVWLACARAGGGGYPSPARDVGRQQICELRPRFAGDARWRWLAQDHAALRARVLQIAAGDRSGLPVGCPTRTLAHGLFAEAVSRLLMRGPGLGRAVYQPTWRHLLLVALMPVLWPCCPVAVAQAPLASPTGMQCDWRLPGPSTEAQNGERQRLSLLVGFPVRKAAEQWLAANERAADGWQWRIR